MNRSLAVVLALGSALVATISLPCTALAQGMTTGAPGGPGSVCNDFVKLRAEAEQKANLVKTASKNKQDRKGMCDALTHFSVAEEAALKFLQSNQVWCGIPQQAVDGAKSAHEQTVKFRTMVCSAGPVAKPRAPSLSEAIGMPDVDTSQNTKTGKGGTFDTLTGNPLAK